MSENVLKWLKKFVAWTNLAGVLLSYFFSALFNENSEQSDVKKFSQVFNFSTEGETRILLPDGSSLTYSEAPEIVPQFYRE